MAEEAAVGCARPAGGPVNENEPELHESPEVVKEEGKVVMVGQKPLILLHRGICRESLSILNSRIT